MKVREIIEVSKWVKNSGFSYTSTYSDQIIDISDISKLEEMDWSWWEVSEESSNDFDYLIEVKFYAEEDEDLEKILAKHSIWESELK